MPYVEDFSEFKARQNCEAIQLQNGSWLFANGAQWLIHLFDGAERYATHSEPPTEKFALLRAKRQFIQTKLNRENNEYERAISEYQQAARNAAMYPETCPPVPALAFQCLRDGWERLHALRNELNALDAELAQAPEALQQRADAARHAALVAERQKVADAFCSLNPASPPPASLPVVPLVEAFKHALSHQPPTSDLFGIK